MELLLLLFFVLFISSAVITIQLINEFKGKYKGVRNGYLVLLLYLLSFFSGITIYSAKDIQIIKYKIIYERSGSEYIPVDTIPFNYTSNKK